MTELELIELTTLKLMGNNLKSIVIEKGLSQQELAIMLDKRESEISKFLSGRHNFTILTLVEVCHKLEIKMTSLFIKE